MPCVSVIIAFDYKTKWDFLSNAMTSILFKCPYRRGRHILVYDRQDCVFTFVCLFQIHLSIPFAYISIHPSICPLPMCFLLSQQHKQALSSLSKSVTTYFISSIKAWLQSHTNKHSLLQRNLGVFYIERSKKKRTLPFGFSSVCAINNVALLMRRELSLLLLINKSFLEKSVKTWPNVWC